MTLFDNIMTLVLLIFLLFNILFVLFEMVINILSKKGATFYNNKSTKAIAIFGNTVSLAILLLLFVGLINSQMHYNYLSNKLASIKNFAKEQDLIIIPKAYKLINNSNIFIIVNNQIEDFFNFFHYKENRKLTELYIEQIKKLREDSIKSKGVVRSIENNVSCFNIKTREMIKLININEATHLKIEQIIALNSLESIKDEYPEIEICGSQNNWIINSVISNSASKPIYTFQKEDYKEIQQLVNQGKFLDEAINLSIQEHITKEFLSNVSIIH